MLKPILISVAGLQRNLGHAVRDDANHLRICFVSEQGASDGLFFK